MNYLKKTIEYLFYLFIFLLPWQTRWIWHEGKLNGDYWEYGSFSFYGTDIVFIAILFLTLFYLIWNYKEKTLLLKNLKTKFDSFKKTNQLLISLLFFVFLTIGVSFNHYLAFYAASRFFQGILLFYITLIVVFSFKKVAWTFIFSALVQSFLAIIQFLSQSTFASKWLGLSLHDPAIGGTFVVETVLRRWLRSYGSLPHPNILAGFLVISLIILIGLYIKTKNGYQKIVLTSSFVVISFGVLTTFSRSAILALVLAIILFWLKLIRSRSSLSLKIDLIKLTLIVLVVVVAFGLMYSQPFLTRFAGEGRLEIKSNVERLDYNDQAFSIIKPNWLLGAGIGNYTLAAHSIINPLWEVWQYQPVHNIYLLIWSELGLVGLGIFVVFFLKIFLLAKGSGFDSWQNTYFIIFISLALTGLFDHYLWTLGFGIMISWLCLGLLIKSKIDFR